MSKDVQEEAVPCRWSVFGGIFGRKYKVLVQCECGVCAEVRADHLLIGRTKECKSCSGKRTVQNHPIVPRWKLIGKLCGTRWKSIINGAQKRGIKFSITKEEAWSLLVAQDFRCAISGVGIDLEPIHKGGSVDWSVNSASLDRIDSSKGYELGNIQWVHKKINRMKGALSDEEFISWCKLVAEKT